MRPSPPYGLLSKHSLTLSRKASIALIVVLSSLIGFFLVEGIREQELIFADAARKEIESKAMLLRASLEDPRLWNTPQALQASVERLAAPRSDDLAREGRHSPQRQALDILILNSERMVIAGSVPGELGQRYHGDPGGEIRLTMGDGTIREFKEGGAPTAPWIALPLEVGHARKGTLLFRSSPAVPTGRSHNMVGEVAREAILIAVPALALILWLTRRYLLTPIRLLKEGASAWKRGDLSHRIAFPGTDELGQLRDAFNEMAGALQAQHAALAQQQAELEESLRRNREAQAQLVQSEKLASVGTLAAGVAHELNQPLMLVRGYAQRLLSRGKDLAPWAQEDIETIEGETSRMMKIIRHLKDFSRKSTGDFQEVDLNAIVRSSCDLLSGELRTHRVEVRVTLDDTLPSVWADPVQFMQVFINLITNARDALDGVGGGLLTIQSRRRPEAYGVEVSFTDTGPGIDPHVLPRIFDPFFTTKAVGSGTGLGLSIALGLVQAHGGQLTASSEPGRGARFTVSLPAGGKRSDGICSNPDC